MHAPAPHPAPTPTTPTTAAAPAGTTVQLLHRWDPDIDETSLHRDYPAALNALAATVRADWPPIAHRHDIPATPDELSDAEVVLAFYARTSGDPEAPTSGESRDAGFEIVEEPVLGPRPNTASLRVATLRVLDADSAEPDTPPVTYCLDVFGLSVAVSHDPDGHPVVLIAPEDHLSGVPVTVRLEDPRGPGGFEVAHRLS